MFQTTVTIDTHGEGDIINLTPAVEDFVRKSNVDSGIVTIFVVGSTAAVTTIEYEPGVLSDLRRSLAVLAPDDAAYAHDRAWGDGNGRSHVKAALVGPSLSVPVAGGVPACGTWQQIVLLELDVRETRRRSVVITIQAAHAF
ncbi:MAG: secondary thiamine-phosphate synthase enzyme [Methanoculleus sp. SDB]|nr:MAG: secondary thiamine-phosphate synthase enzyme [Methanoculleus sp. SDB]